LETAHLVLPETDHTDAMLASCTVMVWKDTSKCCGQVIIKRQCKVMTVQILMGAFNPM